ncbi:MAG: hypothetical protein ABJO36_12060 [Litorimonas sp.]
MTNFDPKPISDATLNARRACIAIDGFPAELPQTLEQAYAVQLCSIKNWDADLIGFKVGGVPPKFQEQFPTIWQAGPMFADQKYVAKSGDSIEVTVFEGGFAAYEAELVFVLKNLDQLDQPLETIEETHAFISSVHLGAEIASSPNPFVNDLGPGSIISDLGNNAGVVLGPEAPLSILDDFSKLEVVLHIDDLEIGRATPNAGENGPMGALRFILNHFISLKGEIDLPENCLISSGAITGVHSSHAGTKGHIKFGDLAEYELRMVPRKPKA